MAIRVTCDCGRVLNVPDSFAGKKGKCPACKAVLQIPAEGQSPEALAPEKPPPAPKEVEYVEFRCPKTGKRARLPKAMAGATVVCPICGQAHSISHAERTKDLVSLSRVIKEKPAEAVEEELPATCPSCGKAVAAVKDNCLYCGARLRTGSVRARGIEELVAEVKTSAWALVALAFAGAALGMWALGWRGAYATVGVLAVLAGGWAVIAVRGAVRPAKGEWMGWASVACGVSLAVVASVASLTVAPIETTRIEPREDAEGLGEFYTSPDESFSFRPPARWEEVAPSFILGSPDPRAVAGMKAEGEVSVAVLSYYEPTRKRPTGPELALLARELTGRRAVQCKGLFELGGLDVFVAREVTYSENRLLALHVAHVLFFDRPGMVPEERLRRGFIVSAMRFTPEYMELIQEEALARDPEKEPLPPEELEKDRIKLVDGELASGGLSNEEAKALKEATRLSEEEFRRRMWAWAKNIRRVVRLSYYHKLIDFDVARRRSDSRKLLYSCASALLVEVAREEMTASEAAESFSDEVRFFARAMEKMRGGFPLKRRRLSSWFSKLAAGVAREPPKEVSRTRLTGRMAAIVRSKALESGLDKRVRKLPRLDLNLASDEEEEWVKLVMGSVSTFRFEQPGEAGEE